MHMGCAVHCPYAGYHGHTPWTEMRWVAHDNCFICFAGHSLVSDGTVHVCAQQLGDQSLMLDQCLLLHFWLPVVHFKDKLYPTGLPQLLHRKKIINARALKSQSSVSMLICAD